MEQKPTQAEIDSVASFVEAVNELELEPFFSQDEPRSVSMCGDKRTFELGDRFHFRSALITFRRIWMMGEAENFEHVCGVMHRTAPDARPFIKAFASDVRNLKKSNKHWVKVAVNGEKLVNLWLNTVFAHSGLRGSGPTRHEFDRMVEKYGQGAMEYAFRHLVFSIGLSYRNAAKIARQFLDICQTEFQLGPSFRLGSAFGTRRRERTPDGHLIIRQSSSEHFSEESYELRFARILSRQAFSNLKSVLEKLEFTERELLKLVIKHESFLALVAESELELRILPEMPKQPDMSEGIRFFCGLHDMATHTVSALQCSELEMMTDEKGIMILETHYAAFRKQLVNC